MNEMIEINGRNLVEADNIPRMEIRTAHGKSYVDETVDDIPACNDEEVQCGYLENNDETELVSLNEVPTLGNEDVFTPKVGMPFESMEAAILFYKNYGCQKGFSIRTRDTKKRGKEDEINVCVLVCSREVQVPNVVPNSETQAKSRYSSTSRCGCKARMRVCMNDYKSWVVKSFNEEHVHDLVSPCKIPMMSSAKTMPKSACILAEKFKEVNLPVSKVPALLGGEVLGFDKRDCYNHLNSKNKQYKTPNEGDATAAYNYFQKRSAEDPQFRYAIQADEEGRAVNFFWIDGRSRMQYQHFGDVVSFDTTYKKNAYQIPFGPFTGINHHYQSICFGCALLLDETEESFVWLFEMWLAHMGGIPPVTILTDQDKAMTSAVRKVFPNTRHRFCYWHITSKFSEHLSHAYKKNGELSKELKKCLRNTYSVSEFEARWEKIMRKNDLQDNEWLKGLYEIRASWVPVYFRDTFCGGMMTTGRSELMNAVYKNYFSSDYDLRKFIPQMERCLRDIVLNEKQEDFDSDRKDRVIREPHFLMKNVAMLYTKNIFVKFRDQFERALYYTITKEETGDGFTSYTMRSRKKDTSRIWTVEFNRESLMGSCQCKMYEFVGIPCRHLIKLFLHFDIDELPKHYILRRWTKRANTYRVLDRDALVNSAEDSKMRRLMHGSHLANQVADTAAEDSEKYTQMIEAFTALLENFKEIEEARVKDRSSSSNPPVVFEEVEPSINASTPKVTFLDPNISVTKGRKKATDTRFKRPLESIVQTGNRKCGGCGEMVTHNIRTCPNPKKQTKTK